MSLTRIVSVASCLSVTCFVCEAYAEDDVFMHDDSEQDETAFVGTLTSSSLFYKEIGGVGTVNPPGTIEPENSSEISRVFSDVRLRLDAQHIKGGAWDARFDFRGRLQPSLCNRQDMLGNELPCPPTQSGSYGGTELDAREVYLKRRGKAYDITFGRQFIAESAFLKLDGLKIKKNDGDASCSAFAGFFPNRTSRDVRQDYPVVPEPIVGDPTTTEDKRIMPLFAGVGASYNKGRAYGTLGAAGILPLARELSTARIEKSRVLLAANGYFRLSNKTDLYHSAVVDVMGQAGAGLTNLAIGASHRLRKSFRLDAQLTRVDTETLSVQIQNRLETADPVQGALQNNVFVRRTAAESARVAATASIYKRRFDVSVVGLVRRRPGLNVQSNGFNLDLSAAQTGEASVQFVDRKFFGPNRVSLSLAKTFGLGDANLDRSTAFISRVNWMREILDGKGELDTDISYVKSTDDGLGLDCQPGADIINCYGRSEASTLQLGATLYYRWKKKIYFVAQGNGGQQSLATTYVEDPIAQGSVFMFSGFLRVAYRL